MSGRHGFFASQSSAPPSRRDSAASVSSHSAVDNQEFGMGTTRKDSRDSQVQFMGISSTSIALNAMAQSSTKRLVRGGIHDSLDRADDSFPSSHFAKLFAKGRQGLTPRGASPEEAESYKDIFENTHQVSQESTRRDQRKGRAETSIILFEFQRMRQHLES